MCSVQYVTVLVLLVKHAFVNLEIIFDPFSTILKTKSGDTKICS